MFNLTNKSKDFYLNILNVFNTKQTKDEGIKLYCQSEYGKDWYWAYNSYQIDGKFPNPLKRNV